MVDTVRQALRRRPRGGLGHEAIPNFTELAFFASFSSAADSIQDMDLITDSNYENTVSEPQVELPVIQLQSSLRRSSPSSSSFSLRCPGP
jgi:hypothetical protein